MKQLTLIAFLLLGVVGCTKKDQQPEDFIRVESEIKGPPLVWGLVCLGCNAKYDWGKWYCQTNRDIEDPQPITYTYSQICVKFSASGARTDGFYDYDIIRNINNQHPGTYLEPDLDTAFGANFADNWLTEFPKGAQYYGYFEFISHVAFIDGIPLADIPAHYAFARDTYIVADSLMNGSWGCVPITSAYKADAEDMIDYYRLKLSEPLFQATLDSIQADLDRHEGLTKAQMYDIFEE